MVRMYRVSPSDQLAAETAGLGAAATVAVLLLGFWLITKSGELLVRVWSEHPENPALRVSGGICLGVTALAAVFLGDAPLVALCGASLLAHLVVAKIVELYYDDRFQPRRTRQTMLRDVLKRPWWTPVEEDAA